MLKKLMALMLALFTFAAFAAVDVNKATQAELDGIKGIGPGIAGKIMDERKKGSFKDWGDFIERVKGVGEGNAAKFSAEGLTVGGVAYKSATATKDDKKDTKADAKLKADDSKVQKAAEKTSKDTKAEAPKLAASTPKK